MIFHECRKPVGEFGCPPQEFLEALVSFGRTAPDEIFAPNAAPVDIYTSIKSTLGTLVGHDPSGTPIYQWDSLMHRRCALLDVLDVLAGHESGWNYNEGVDTTNASSLAHLTGQETGIFQVSYDSLWLAHDSSLHDCLVRHGVTTINPRNFIEAMKANHELAIEYCARLLRVSIAWDGPIKRHEIHPHLRRECVAELQALV